MKYILLILSIIGLSFNMETPTNYPIPDPSVAYCKFLGYDIVVRKDLRGNEYAVCIFPDGSECDTWAFYRGSCGQKYSYCSKKACETRSISDDLKGYTYCACVCLDSLGNENVIPLYKFMEQNGDTLNKSNSGKKRKQ